MCSVAFVRLSVCVCISVEAVISVNNSLSCRRISIKFSWHVNRIYVKTEGNNIEFWEQCGS